MKLNEDLLNTADPLLARASKKAMTRLIPVMWPK